MVCTNVASPLSPSSWQGMGGKKKQTMLNRRGAAAANEWQAFIWACKEDRLDLAKVMLDDFGADVNMVQPNSSSSNAYSALHWAATKGQLEMARFLLERGIKKEITDKHNNTALQLAEKKGNEELAALLK